MKMIIFYFPSSQLSGMLQFARYIYTNHAQNINLTICARLLATILTIEYSRSKFFAHHAKIIHYACVLHWGRWA